MVTLKSGKPNSNVAVDVTLDLDTVTPEDLRFVGAMLAMIGAYEPGPEDADLFEEQIAALRKAVP